jgi:hypothetical protein
MSETDAGMKAILTMYFGYLIYIAAIADTVWVKNGVLAAVGGFFIGWGLSKFVRALKQK